MSGWVAVTVIGGRLRRLGTHDDGRVFFQADGAFDPPIASLVLTPDELAQWAEVLSVAAAGADATPVRPLV